MSEKILHIAEIRSCLCADAVLLLQQGGIQLYQTFVE